MGLDFTGIGSVADLAKALVSHFLPPTMSDAEKAKAQLEMQEALQAHENAMMAAQKDIIVSEMTQDDKFTKRARPMIVYAGLAFIFLVHVFLPMIAWIVLMATGKPMANMPGINLPEMFWTAWGGVCSIWVIGRSAEKFGVGSKLVSAITGSK